jgi:hypothetical protein
MTNQKAMIAEAAYFKSERRGFLPGNEIADWLEAEREVEAILNGTLEPLVKKPKSKSAAPTTGKRPTRPG